MPMVRSNGLDLCHESLGDPDAPSLLLVMGLGAQLIEWPAEFCVALAGHGFHVVRFDNRDIGLSTWLDKLGRPDLPALFGGDLSSAAYRLSDMAADTAGLIEALGLARVHVVGASMGGMIAQQLTVDRPDLVASLASIMSTTGDPAVGQTTLENPGALMSPPGLSREQAIDAALGVYQAIRSTGFEVNADELKRTATATVDRGYHPEGMERQFAAIAASPDRTESLGSVRVPTVVIHGEADPLIDVSGGRATAAAVPGAELVTIPGMGHDLPRGAWDRIIDAIVANAKKAG